MWGTFFKAYSAAKGSGAPSALDPLIALLRGYPRSGASDKLEAIAREMARVSSLKRWFGANPGEKYAVALVALDVEVAEERFRLRPDSRPRPHQEDIQRRSLKYAEFLRRTKTESESFKEVTSAFKTILEDPHFVKYLNEEIGWLSGTSWAKWAVRTIQPAMLSGFLAKDLRDELREMALTACSVRKPYLEQYLVELSIYCSAAADRADIGVAFAQASTVFGPLLGPLLALPSAGLAGAATSGGRAVATRIGGVVLRRQLVEIREDERQLGARKEKANLMRFTHAWLKYVTQEAATDFPTQEALERIFAEFGGKQGCRNLYALLSAM